MELQPGRIGGIAGVSAFRRSPRARPPRVLPEGDYLAENGRLTLAGRVVIAVRLRDQWRPAAIARALGVHRSTVKREIEAGSVDGRYRPKIAQRLADERRRRPKSDRVKIRPGTELWDELIARLNAKQSPEQIAGRLALDFAGRDAMQVSHETIYQALYVQGAGALRHELAVEKALRSGRTTRRPRSKLGPRSNRSWIGTATITARPAEAEDRAVSGHWEGDLIIGGGNQRSALITLFERTTRFCLISRITVHDAATVTDRLTEMAARLPAALWRSLTWDQGVEMADHARFTIATGCPVFFCDPHSPWQRPTNENGNGLLREFFPKGTDFTKITDQQVAEAEHLLNTRPRKILNYQTPAEKLAQLITVAKAA
ncbi:IS30 family transposase [Microlunatus parietis]|uniref:IS30 family transposase n=1 Tax=Microlunatus parietis TaxID=682979 RepID=A0A7Y9I316_9ACTN|nr:IS30 family transposase [Microlunatus parietis]NYE69096.1 IS30 family transposase [Microlunatus parietis]